MIRASIAAVALLSASAGTAQQIIVKEASAPLRIQLDSMPLGALTTMLMRDVMRVPYVISSEVLAESRAVSVNLTMPREDIPVRVVRFLRAMGLTVTLRAGTVYVTKGNIQPAPSAYLPSGSPLQQVPAMPMGAPIAAPIEQSASGVDVPGRIATPDPAERIAIVRPAHRPAIELVDVLQGVLPGLSIAARRDSAPQGAQIVDRLEPDELVFAGSAKLVDRAIELVKILDRPRPVVSIRGVVFEVRSSSSSKSALAILASIGGLQVGSGSPVPGDQFVRIATGGLSAVLSATSGDGRFKVVAEPSLAAVSGSSASINSGSEVPTVGAVSFSEQGAPVRSVVYRSSGLSLTVAPTVRGGEIDLQVTQERSSFARTTTGVDDSPTLNTSRATAHVAIAPGETIAIAGLDLRSEGSQRSGFLGGILGGKSKETDQSQLLLLLQAEILPQERTGKTVVFTLDDRPGEVGSAEGGSPLRKAASPPLPATPDPQAPPSPTA